MPTCIFEGDIRLDSDLKWTEKLKASAVKCWKQVQSDVKSMNKSVQKNDAEFESNLTTMHS